MAEEIFNFEKYQPADPRMESKKLNNPLMGWCKENYT